MACTGRTAWPVLRSVRFNAPLIVPQDSQVAMRTLALAELLEDTTLRVRVAIRSGQDGFQQNLFEAECWFGNPTQDDVVVSRTLALPRPLPEPLDLDPETLNPVPLFQGKFFRRIENIRRRNMGRESLTEIRAPTGEQYFQGIPDERPMTPSPAMRDACWQSGALILPPGCLPRRLAELRFYRRATSQERVFCRAKVRNQASNGFVVDLAVFDGEGKPLETMKGLLLEQTGAGVAAKPPPAPLTLSRVASDLQALLPQVPHAIALVQHEELEQSAKPTELANAELEQAQAETPLPRRASALANLVAARRAALAYAHQAHGNGVVVAPGSIALTHRSDGKPELLFANRTLGGLFRDADISLADSSGLSLAWLGLPPVGADLEKIEARNAEIWRGLLGQDGYALALHVMAQTGEPFDWAATRVWTLLEAGRKAGSLKRVLPEYESARGGPWLGFGGEINGARTEILSVTVACPPGKTSPRKLPGTAVLAVAVRRVSAELDRPAQPAASGATNSFEAVWADYRNDMERLQVVCAGDPREPGLAARHAQFISVIEATSQRMELLERTAAAADLPALRRRFQETILLPFLDGSENFRHTLIKPFGYAGDFRLLEMLAANRCGSRGLAYHFDQSQLEYPASVACRRRIEWISDGLAVRLKSRSSQEASALQTESGHPPPLVILDLGVGAAPVEQRLLRQGLAAPLCVHAVDREASALEYVCQNLAGPRLAIHPWRLDLREPSALSKIGELAAQADVAIALGLLEALADHEAVPLLQAVLRSLPAGGVFYTENFVPTHPTRSILEWFLDFRLSYRSLEELRTVALRAGADPSRMELKLDSTGSLALLRMVK